jgi:molybdopterin-containing oxidoreductase family iron-sulfur binding subunit
MSDLVKIEPPAAARDARDFATPRDFATSRDREGAVGAAPAINLVEPLPNGRGSLAGGERVGADAVEAGRRDYWRSLDDLAGAPEFREFVEREFPRQAIGWNDDEDPAEGRRQFLKLMGASLALGGLAACTRQPTEHIMPYVRQPEELILGRPLFYATATTLNGVATGVLAESHEGRPTKLEGNPEHPASMGALDAMGQAAVLQLYDPDRSQAVRFQGEIRAWGTFAGMLRDQLAQQRAKNGAGIRILTETVTSPTLAAQIRAAQKLYPGAKWHQWDPAGPHSARAAAVQAFGQPVNTYHDLSKADVIVSLGADFLASGPGSLRYARQFARRREVSEDQKTMNRLYVVESMPTPTGTKADHRLPLRAGDIEEFAWALAVALGVAQGPRQGENADVFKWIGGVARDLQNHIGASLVIAGECQPPAVHVLTHLINAKLGNAGKTVIYTDPIEAEPVNQLASLDALVKDLDAGAVDLLLILGGNPAFNTPVELGMRDRLKKAKVRVHLSLSDNETSEVCQWHIPDAHFLETWGDARAFDGTVTIQQPLIQPLYGGRSAIEVLQMFTGDPEKRGLQIVKDNWNAQHKGADFEAWWRRAVHDGVVAGTALPAKTPAPRGEGLTAHAGSRRLEGKFEVIFRPDPSIYDGRFANNGWLQELPKPITKLTWDNAAIVSPATAAQRLGGAQTGDMVKLTYMGRSLRAPLFVQPGHANGSITVHLGYGRTRAGRTGTGIGFDPYGLRTAKALWHDVGLDAERISGKYEFASTQNYHTLDIPDRRHIIQKGDLADFLKNPESIHEGAENPPRGLTMYPEWKYEGNAWGMAIDLNACTGCGACVTACQAENNIAVVGKDQVRRGRVMQWIRVDSYYQGGANDPAIYNQPVPCMQCENAPCELVCPVQATSHSSEGLNDMVYNRCVGTRYCANNCPYKVRRFNFYLYSDFDTPSLQLGRNPDVTVRSRGVMEKCTYCVQRINHAKIDSEREGREVRDGEILTACQQTCPAEAIVFGNINDKNSRVAKLKANERNYSLLADLNTRPRTTYLATLRNPNPELES